MRLFHAIALDTHAVIFVTRVEWIPGTDNQYTKRTRMYNNPTNSSVSRLMDWCDAHPLLAEYSDFGVGGVFVNIYN